ncbi:hypothetical protein Esi_0458_0010 [Ectocarpus siliculosus]|uniref:Uncharacterized protein n=1 Tax=Ectocarpus siliculosus TaxID=2880 RepID=D7G1R5_ECTSI|nr:hypothetical protein Esi_0458_0010 [Ectocarpus siliculosus]|eukprot:CBJ33310.1 hypothetical protein Esi_0458_0010 [Ectocarpus siliculosus]
MAKGPYAVGPFSSPSGTVTAPPSPPSARSMAAPARNYPGGDDAELGELLGGGLHDLDDEGWSPEDADLMAAFLEDDFSGEILFGLDTTSSTTAASAVSDQPGSVPSCPMADFDDHTLELLASSGVISGAPGVAMPSTSVGAGADASDVATGASDVGAALPRMPATPPAPGTMPAFGLTPPIATDTSSDTNVPHPPSISSTLAAPFTSTTATPSFVSSDVGAALPRMPTTPPAPGTMPAFGLTPPIATDTSSDTNVPHPPSISSTLASPFTSTTATPSFVSRPITDSVAAATVAAAVVAGSTTSEITALTPPPAPTSALNNSRTFSAVTTGSTTSGPTTPRTDSVASTTADARETAAAKAAKAAVAVAVATSAPSKLSTSALAVSPVLGTPSTSTSDGIDHALAMAIQALKIADRAVDDSRLARSPETTSDNEKGRLSTALAEFTEKMSKAAPRTSATEMMDAALAACMEQLLFLEERTFVEEETAFSDDVAVRADLGRAMMALNDEKKKKREAEIRAILGDVRKRRSKRIRSAALSNVRRERDARPAWDHFSLREMWKAGEIVTL